MREDFLACERGPLHARGSLACERVPWVLYRVQWGVIGKKGSHGGGIGGNMGGMIGVASFLFPMVLTAAAAAAAPVIIHLMMRTKPRLVIFPAMRFVLKTHKANLSKLKLKHLVLLGMRMAMIVLIAFLIARAELPNWSASPEEAVPTAAVIVLDASASMDYRYQGKSLLARGKQMAAELVQSLPDGSLVLVLNTGQVSGGGKFLGARDVVTKQILDTAQGNGHASLAAALGAAVERLGRIDMPRKEVYVMSDMTARSWRDAVDFASVAGVRFVLLDCWGGQDINFALDRLSLGAMSVPLGAEATIETVLHSRRAGGQVRVQVELDGRKVEERPVALGASSSESLRLTVSPRREGVVHGRVILDVADPLAADNVRHFTLQVNSPTELLVLRDPTTIGRGDWTTFLMANAIAPSGQAPGRQASVRRKTISADRLAAAHLARPHVVLVSNVSSLAAAQWKLLETYVREGGRLWIVAGPLTAPAGYSSEEARRLMPVSLTAQEELARPVGWRAGKLDHPMFLPFGGDENPPLSAVRCTRRFGVQTVAGDAGVLMSYTDDVPAVVLRRVGAGRVLLWNFSPARQCSNLAGLEQFPILARRATKVLTGQVRAETMYLCGDSVVVPFPRRLAQASVTLRRPGADSDRPISADVGGRTVTVLADKPGPYRARFARGDLHASRGFSVNVSAAESDMHSVGPDRLGAMFPSDGLVIAGNVEAVMRARHGEELALDLTIPLLLALVVLMTGESFFANRFYRRSAMPNDPAV